MSEPPLTNPNPTSVLASKYYGQLSMELVGDAKTRRDWLNVPYVVFGGDPAWIPPLRALERLRISSAHNPFLTTDAALFLAYRNGSPVGRISARINRSLWKRSPDCYGHFGFFDCIDDAEVARALIEAAVAWLNKRGARRMEGPYNFGISRFKYLPLFHFAMRQEYGLLVSGFDSSPSCLTLHSPPWIKHFLETAGFEKSLDTFAYRVQPARLPERLLRLAGLANSMNSLSAQPLGSFSMEDEVRLIIDIYGDALRDEWGFTPLGEDEVKTVLGLLRSLMRGHYGRVVLLDGTLAGVMLIVPNFNELIANFHGKLLPLNWVRLLCDLKGDRFRTARIPLTAVRQKHLNTPVASAVLALLAAELWEPRWREFDWMEFSQIPEPNKQAQAMARLVAGEPTKVFRIYHRQLD
jgi:hypothetical protein